MIIQNQYKIDEKDKKKRNIPLIISYDRPRRFHLLHETIKFRFTPTTNYTNALCIFKSVQCQSIGQSFKLAIFDAHSCTPLDVNCVRAIHVWFGFILQQISSGTESIVFSKFVCVCILFLLNAAFLWNTDSNLDSYTSTSLKGAFLLIFIRCILFT